MSPASHAKGKRHEEDAKSEYERAAPPLPKILMRTTTAQFVSLAGALVYTVDPPREAAILAMAILRGPSEAARRTTRRRRSMSIGFTKYSLAPSWIALTVVCMSLRAVTKGVPAGEGRDRRARRPPRIAPLSLTRPPAV